MRPRGTPGHSGSHRHHKRVLVLQRHLRESDVVGLGERVENLLPDAGAAPALVPAIDRLPGAELLREGAPGSASLDDPEHTGEQGAVVVARPAPRWLGRRQERHDPLPLGITELEAAAWEHLDGGRAGARGQVRPGMLVGSPGSMAALSHGLVLPAKQRPTETEGRLGCRLGQRQEQAAHLGHGQGNQAFVPPPCCSCP
jgi:hypothetical protein